MDECLKNSDVCRSRVQRQSTGRSDDVHGSDMFSREAFLGRLASKAELARENINKIANFVSAKNLRLSQLLEEKNEIAEEAINP